jgi:hypothetical protein
MQLEYKWKEDRGWPMSKASRSGITVRAQDVPLILGMVARGDRRHDIAAWFGLNQGRIKETEDGKHGPLAVAAANKLPPSGSPGIKARRLRPAIRKVRELLDQPVPDFSAIRLRLDQALADFDKDE